MRKRFCFIGLFMMVLLFACQENDKQINEPIIDHLGNQFTQSFDGLEAFLNYQEKIENKKDLLKLSSLLYTEKNGNTYQSVAFLEKNSDIAKAQLIATNTEKGQQIQYTFYFLKGVLSMAEVNFNQVSKNFIYRIFFNAEQSPIATYIHRIVDAEQATEIHNVPCKNQPWLNQKIEKSIKQLSDMQNQEGDFSLYFTGFNEAYNKQFIEFGNENFSTNLAFIPQEELVQRIKKSPQSYHSTLFQIQFEEITEASGFSYQLLTDIQEK